MKIFLIGFMGVGKTTVGKRLAKRLNLPFIDLDEYIARKKEMSVQDIFAYLGEDYFRKSEQQSLQEVMQQPEFVLACGGGTPCFFDNMERMNQAGLTIYLEAGIAFISSRIRTSRVSRPLVNKLSEDSRNTALRTLFMTRDPFYIQAKLRVDVEKLSAGEALECVLQNMREHKFL